MISEHTRLNGNSCTVQAARGDSEAMGQLNHVSGYQLQALQECAEELRSLQEQVRIPSAV